MVKIPQFAAAIIIAKGLPGAIATGLWKRTQQAAEKNNLP
jgi:hypothetical protein